MNGYLLALVALIYLGTAVNYGLDHRPGMAIAFVAYALANLGFMVDLK